jgi:hypothetical protein
LLIVVHFPSGLAIHVTVVGSLQYRHALPIAPIVKTFLDIGTDILLANSSDYLPHYLPQLYVILSFSDVELRNDLGTDNLFCPALNRESDACELSPVGIGFWRVENRHKSGQLLRIENIAHTPPHRSYPQPPPTN